MKTKLLKFGFEIEGEYSIPFKMKIASLHLGNIKGDGSVQRCNPGLGDLKFHSKHNTPLDTAEFASTAFSVTALKPAKNIFKLYQEAYENGEYHWNKSSGFHVHTSYEPKMPFDIFSMRFYNFFIGRMKEKYPNEYESRKSNRYCADNLKPKDLIRKQSRYDRYKSLNFLPALERHGTAEFRIFPTAEPDKMLEYLLFILETINMYLEKSNKEKIKVVNNCYLKEEDSEVEEIVVATSTIKGIKNQSDITISTKEKI